MADSEAKARQAFEEAEKKSKKGGGFLGGLFGGGGSVTEACELYNQVDYMGYSSNAHFKFVQIQEPETSSKQIYCPVEGCSVIMSNCSELEDHYAAVHSFQCAQCRNKFSTARSLEIHIEEEHSPFFAAQLSLYPDRALFECFATPHCNLRFASKELRDSHCSQVHYLINGGRVKEDGRKQITDIEQVVQNISISDGNELQFGEEQERMFERKRKKLTAKRILK
jgi:hypothetical protein